MKYWILKNREPFRVKDRNVWAQWNLSAQIFVGYDRIFDGKEVITKFFGKSQKKGNPPALFFTKVEGGDQHFKPKYYSTWNQAVKGHSQVLKQIAELNSN